jgi:bacterioferritin-associated ferredoxin
MIVCHCRGVTDRDLRRCISAGARSVGRVSRESGASTCCGGCRPLVRKIVEAELAAEERCFLPMLQPSLVGA